MSPDPVNPPGVEGFRFQWREPGDDELTWKRDDMHAPFALAPLAADYFELIGEGFAYMHERLGEPVDSVGRVWNGYAYIGTRPRVPDDHQGPLEADSAARKAVPTAASYWRERLPELKAIYAAIGKIDVSNIPPVQLADAWEEAWRASGRAWRIHFYAIVGPYQALDDLVDIYESAMAGSSATEALRLVQGRVEELQAVERGVEHLTMLAKADPAVSSWLRGREPLTLDGLAMLPTGGGLFGELEAFLAEHGHLGQSFDDLSLASWREEPQPLLTEIAKRLDRPDDDARDRQARLSSDGDRVAEEVRTKLADRPEQLDEFERTLRFAREVGPLTEGHNYWIDRKVHATLRGFAMRVGRRLVQLGVLHAPDDILYLHRHEVDDLLRQSADRRTVVSERRREHARLLEIDPPPLLGVPPRDDAVGRFRGTREDSSDAAFLRGTGASAGVVRGTGRLTLGPKDFARVEPGDIIVCPSSNPSWVPLFAIAGGLVTDTGGVLSHAAVVAREFGLPAVVGTGDGTSRIADGRTVELDGTTGTVQLL